MTTLEVEKSLSLTGEIREQVRLNQERGDGASLNGHGWYTYDSDISLYERSFEGALNGSIHDFLEDKPFPVVIDLMGPSEAVSTLFEKFPKKPKLGIAVSLDDLRSDQQKTRDKRLNIEQIAGDIMKSSTWDRIEKELQGHKADLIMERAHLGLNCIPGDPRLYAMLLNKAWELLSKENGVLIAEVPTLFLSQAQRMMDSFRNNNKMNASTGRSSGDTVFYIKIVKTPDSPEKLPFLT